MQVPLHIVTMNKYDSNLYAALFIYFFDYEMNVSSKPDTIACIWSAWASAEIFILWDLWPLATAGCVSGWCCALMHRSAETLTAPFHTTSEAENDGVIY